MNNNYNSQRSKLMLPEYGRHVHEMVDYLRTITDRTLRNEQAQLVIDVMGNLNPTLRDSADFKHKLWDHLFLMADFQLDVDSPYPIPTAKSLAPHPEPLSYPTQRAVLRKHYGKRIHQMLQLLGKAEVEDENERGAVAGSIAKFMRLKSYEYNQEYPNNEHILKDLSKMSDYTIEVSEEVLGTLRSDQKKSQTNHKNRKGFQGGASGGGKGAARTNNKPNHKAGKMAASSKRRAFGKSANRS